MALQTPDSSNFIKEAGDVIAVALAIVLYVFGSPFVKKLLGQKKSGIDTDEQRRVLLSVASDYQHENTELEQALEAAQATIKEQAEMIIELRRQLDKPFQE